MHYRKQVLKHVEWAGGSKVITCNHGLPEASVGYIVHVSISFCTAMFICKNTKRNS